MENEIISLDKKIIIQDSITRTKEQVETLIIFIDDVKQAIRSFCDEVRKEEVIFFNNMPVDALGRILLNRTEIADKEIEIRDKAKLKYFGKELI